MAKKRNSVLRMCSFVHRPTQRSNPVNEMVNNRNLVSGLEIFPNELAVSVPGVESFKILMSFQLSLSSLIITANFLRLICHESCRYWVVFSVAVLQ